MIGPNSFIDIFKSIIALAIKSLRENKKARTYITITLSICLATIATTNIFIRDVVSKDVTEYLIFLTVFISFSLLIVLASYTTISIDKDVFAEELNKLKEEREKIIGKIEEKEDNVIGTIQLSLNQITEYYTINLNQARSSYRWSITAIIIGLITLIAGAWLIFFQETPNITVGIITGISGILVEFIGASNIYIYNKSLTQLNLYFRELINIQDTMLAIELCEKIENNDTKKLEITEKIILSLMGRSSMREHLIANYEKERKYKPLK